MNLTKRAQLRRIPDKGSHDQETIYQILDAGFVASVGFSVDLVQYRMRITGVESQIRAANASRKRR